jgi:hypothetical protein
MDSEETHCEWLFYEFISIKLLIIFFPTQVGLVKSPVEGSTAALVRLQSPVVYSDFVRPVCLPDDDFAKNSIITDYPINSALSSANLIDQPKAEKFFGNKLRKTVTFTEDRQFFQISDKEEEDSDEDSQQNYQEITASELVDEHMNSLKPEAQVQTRSASYYPNHNSQHTNSVHEESEHAWKQCNTLGWSRQREHLQRVQLKMIDMKACENISITTVNSLCAEAAFHKQDCNVSYSFSFMRFAFIYSNFKMHRKKSLLEVR